MALSSITPVPESALVVDDDQDMCWVLEAALAGIGYTATTVGSGKDAISSLAEKAFSIAFVDARLPDIDGLRLIGKLRGLQPGMRIIMISGYFLEDDLRILEAVKASEINGFLAKPFRIDAIAAAVTGGGDGNPCP
jgi:DNA-binding NtrC family response regulator